MNASSTFKQPEISAAKVVVKPPKVPCFRCQKSHDSPAAFLMACWKCGRAWHHICHIPPVSEEEILRRIDADKGGMPDLGLRTWQCRKCTKKRQLEPSPGAPQPPQQKPCLTRETTSQPSPWKAESKPPHIPIPIDDDDIIILDGPPAAPSGQAIAKTPNLPPPVPVPVPASISTQADKAQPVGDVAVRRS
ncbi:hypothetical protein L227DRAFT_436581 [Lentinus tigrinus ALCF2SS1-6]|uniref:PHD-type domain-containing protein n=1 Tax=Lentinus tigrinus ALCF2SS1-6 TaxID=1328759 RepID=A0A5C2SG92_9APHY|nr:hypothetical protein L227DRAFT_436581 [Lentinus tigrinus ALCF2SS1-6]